MTTYFISGHLDLTPEEFSEHYAPKIDAGIEAKANFVVGDARGADALAQQYLHSKQLPPHTEAFPHRVKVYHMLDAPRFNAGFPTVGGFKSDADRDMAMTFASYEDICWVRPGREKSGTAKNLKRRKSIEEGNGLKVQVDVVDENGKMLRTQMAPIFRLHSNMVFLWKYESAYCISALDDECCGYFCCDKSSGYRLSNEAIARCRELHGILAVPGHV